jgi:hypothetical protein
MNARFIKESLKTRSLRMCQALVIAAFPALLTIIGTPILLIMAVIHYYWTDLCSKRGEVVEGDVLEGTPGQDSQTLLHFVSENIPCFDSILSKLGQVVPVVMVRYNWEYEGKTYLGAQPIFIDEEIHTDQNGKAKIIFDPQHPQLINYIFTRRCDEDVHNLGDSEILS